MAGLAADADLGPAGGEAVGRRVVILAHAGRVALGAHEVPVLIELGPMQHVVVTDLLVGIEVEPALAALVLRAAVPGDRQRLQPAVGKLDEILLQRIERRTCISPRRRRACRRARRSPTRNLPSLRKKRERTPKYSKLASLKSPSTDFSVACCHGELVLRVAPQLRFGAVAAGAGLAADEAQLRLNDRLAGGLAGDP